MTDLTELAKRVEAATGPDADLDRRIMAALGYSYRAGNRSIGLTYGKAWDSHPYQEWVKGDEVVPDHCVPDYTASLDAATTLVPGGWNWGVGPWEDWKSTPRRAWAWCEETGEDWSEEMNRQAATPALALTAAALRARAAMGEG